MRPLPRSPGPRPRSSVHGQPTRSCWHQLVVAGLRWPGDLCRRQVLDVLGVLHPACRGPLDHCLRHCSPIVDI
eukprot:13054558-Heterocapsa_arctica.AAC.1